VDCLNNIKMIEDHGIRFIAVTQGLESTSRTRHPGFCCTFWVRLRSLKDP
jgi:hypothetical protein